MTGRSKVRQKDDHYVTPAWCVESLVESLPPIEPSLILDLGCGRGSILDALKGTGKFDDHLLHGIEMHAGRARVARRNHDVTCSDVLRDPMRFKETMRGVTTNVLMNPAYKLALPFVTAAIELTQPEGSVHALLRLGFLASKKRRDWWQQHPADVRVLSSRPSFCHVFTCEDCGNKRMRPATVNKMRCHKCRKPMAITTTDAADYGWYTWGPGPRGRIIVL